MKLTTTNVEQLKIGLEIHCQLTNLNTKLFCNCLCNYRNSLPNENTCPICLGLPGSLPLLNRRAVEFASMICLAFGCDIPEKISFYRKNYFYPDLPKNFQITQYNSYEISSIGVNGLYDLSTGLRGDKDTSYVNSGSKPPIRITRIQLEEDPGKIVYEDDTPSNNSYSLIDYNRAGVALVEIVTEPDFTEPSDVRLFLNEIINIFEYLDVCDPNLEGAIRCDVNVSLGGGKKVEIKNISSFKDVEKSIYYEITRQKTMAMHDITVQAETRHWDEKRKITISARSKEEEEDYKYFPEPDIPRINLGGKIFVSKLREQMNELPRERLDRYINAFKITPHTARILINSKKISDFFEEALKFYDSPVEVSNWIVNEMLTKLNESEKSDISKSHSTDLSSLHLSPQLIATMARLVNEKNVNRKLAREVFDTSLRTGEDPLELVEKMDIGKISDSDQISDLIKKIIAKQPHLVKQYKNNPNVNNFILGLVMKDTKGKADPQVAMSLIKEILSKGD
ncbi:Aspartyl/glutamyl-tRNA(Asn/Gln) amidotransferase subunit B [Candidatus Nitrosocosmicus franklandus]|uniref:Aspartyl/glutamyl-tRNA(Asn/Gln) amidotransferase subunit B n=1 Tax=Candidatus Nitrosocosmicus franklandianus TaxID=1798806 RepID=A0A484I8F2_9ARCH|nr:Aspartyl/glutamyl-tRNA(Asn/Gln) amidotransferase subunit B [Candidatus Nitrosocosmicus franklandus]